MKSRFNAFYLQLLYDHFLIQSFMMFDNSKSGVCTERVNYLKRGFLFYMCASCMLLVQFVSYLVNSNYWESLYFVGAKNQYFHRFLFIVTDAKIINAGLWWLYSKLILFIAWKIFSIYVRYCLLWQLVSCEKQVASFPDQWSCRISFTAAFALCVCTGWDAEELG